MSNDIRLSVKLDPADVEKGEKAIREALKRIGVEAKTLREETKKNEDEQGRQAKAFHRTAASLDPLIRAQQKYTREQAALTAGAKAAGASQAELNRLLALSTDKFNAATAGTSGFTMGLGSLKALLPALGLGLVIQQLTGFTRAALEAEEATFRLNFQLSKRPEFGAEVAKQVSDLADALQRITAFDDESIRTAAGNLLRFDFVTPANLEQMIRLTLDLAQAMGMDAPSAAIALGKALDAPGESLKALEGAFGKLNKVEERTIKDLVDLGRESEAASILLDRLNKVAGQAEGYGKTGPGRFKIIANDLNEAKESAGGFWSELVKVNYELMRGMRDEKPAKSNGWVQDALAGLAPTKDVFIDPAKMDAALKASAERLDEIAKKGKEAQKALEEFFRTADHSIENLPETPLVERFFGTDAETGMAAEKFHALMQEFVPATRDWAGMVAFVEKNWKALGYSEAEALALVKAIKDETGSLTIESKETLDIWYSWMGAARALADGIAGINAEAGRWLNTMLDIAESWKQVRDAQRAYKAAQASGDQAGMDSAQAAQTAASMNIWVAAAQALWGALKKHEESQRAKRFGTNAVFSVVQTGQYSTGTLASQNLGAAREINNAIRDLLDAFQQSTGVFINSMGQLSIQVRNDGKEFIAAFNGVVVGTFRTMGEAVAAGAATAILQSDLSGTLSTAMKEMLAVAANGLFGSVEDFKTAFSYIAQIEREASGLSDLDFDLQTLLSRIQEVMGKLQEFGVSASEAFRLSSSWGLQQARDLWNQISGHQMSPKEQREQAQQRAKMLVLQLQLWKIELQARLKYLQGQAELGRREYGGGGGGRAGGLRGTFLLAQASYMQAEAKLQGSYLEAKTQGVQALGNIYQAEIDLINQLIAGIDDLIDDIDINKIRIGGRGGGKGKGGKGVDDFWDLVTGSLSPLDPMKKLQAAEIRYNAALGGKDRDEIEAARRMYLEQAQLVYGGTAMYAQIFEKVMEQTKFLGVLNDREAEARKMTIDQLWKLAKTAGVASKALADLFKREGSAPPPAFSESFSRGGSLAGGNTLLNSSIGGSLDTSSIVNSQNSGTAAVVEQLARVVEEQKQTRRRLSVGPGPGGAPPPPPPPSGTVPVYSGGGGWRSGIDRVM